MACRVRTVNGAIKEVKADNGEDSEYYKDLLKVVKDSSNSTKSDLKNKYAPWVSKRIISSLSDDQLALAMYKQSYSERFRDTLGDWVENPSSMLASLDKNGEPILTPQIQQYLLDMNGGSAKDYLTGKDEPYYSKIPTPEQVTAVSQIDSLANNVLPNGKLKNGEAQASTSEFKAREAIDRMATSGYINELQEEEAIKTIEADKNPTHQEIEKAFPRLLNTDGTLKDGVTPIPDNVIHNSLLERMQSYPNGTIFRSGQNFYSDTLGLGAHADLMAMYNNDGIPSLDFFQFQARDTNLEEKTPKFMSDLYKQQLTDLRNVLVQNGIDADVLGRMQALPVNIMRDGSIEMGNSDPRMEENDALLPISILEQSTNDTVLDNIIHKLSDQSTKKNLTSNGLISRAIQHLQSKLSAKPLMLKAKIDIKGVDAIATEYENNFANQDFSGFTHEETDAFAGKMNDSIAALKEYKDMIPDLMQRNIELGLTKESISSLGVDADKALDILKETSEKFYTQLAESRGVDNLLVPEVVVGHAAKLFSQTNRLQPAADQVLLKVGSEVVIKSNIKVKKEGDKLEKIANNFNKFWKNRQGGLNDALSLFFDRDKHLLIPAIHQDFYKESVQAVKNRDGKWIKNNIDVDGYTDLVNSLKDTAIATTNDIYKGVTDEDGLKAREEALDKVNKKYDLSTDDSDGWFLLNRVQRYVDAEKWKSDELKNLELPINKPAYDMYTAYRGLADKAIEVGLINDSLINQRFVPWADSTMLEAWVNGGSKNIFRPILKGITINQLETGHGEIDTATGQPRKVVPKYFTYPTDNPSQDLPKLLAEFNGGIERYRALTSIEEKMRGLAVLERSKKSIVTSKFGNAGRLPSGELNIVSGNNRNADLFELQRNALLYGHDSSNEFDKALGNVPKQIEALNKALGFDLIPEDMLGKTISLTKTVDSMNKFYQMKTLALSPLPTIANFLGGHYQAWVNAGTYFTKTDLYKAEANVFGMAKNGEIGQKQRLLLDKFNLSYHNPARELGKKSSARLSPEAIQDFIAIGLRKGDIHIRNINGVALLNSSIILNGEILNAREYLRQQPEWQNRFDAGVTQDQRIAIEKGFDQKAKDLISQYGLINNSRIVDGEIEIPGVSDDSNSIVDLVRTHNNIVTKSVGTLNEWQKRGVNMNAWLRAVMTFRNWVPSLAQIRFGELKFDSETDKYNWGRFRTVLAFVGAEHMRSMNGMIQALKGTDRGVEGMTKVFEEQKAKYLARTGKELNMSKADFFQMTRDNLRGQAHELLFFTALMGGLAFTQAIQSGQKDQHLGVSSSAKYFLKALDKVADEVSFYYKPSTALQMISGGIAPVTGVISDAVKISDQFMKECWGMAFKDDKYVEHNQVLKYIMKDVPVINQLSALMPLYAPDVAKDLGIKINPPTTNVH